MDISLLLEKIPARGECTCSELILCAACQQWQERDQHIVNALGFPSKSVLHATNIENVRKQQNYVQRKIEKLNAVRPARSNMGRKRVALARNRTMEQDKAMLLRLIKPWIARNGRLPGSYDWEGGRQIADRPPFGKSSIYREFGKMTAFWLECFRAGIASEEHLQEARRRQKARKQGRLNRSRHTLFHPEQS